MQNQEIPNKRADKSWSVGVVPINGPEDLRETTRGSDIEIVQVRPGKLQGSITHLEIGSLGVSVGRFSSAIRMRGALHRDKIVLGTIIDSADRVTQWWQDVQPGDVGIFPAGAEFDAIHCGRAVYLVISLSLPELSSMLAGEDHLADSAFWNTKRVFRTDPLIANKMLEQLIDVNSIIERNIAAPSAHAADFLKRSIIEPFVASLVSNLPREAERPFYTGARLVTETENYVDTADGRPVHISEICSALKVSRRSLHRAFADTMGIGPVSYLRLRRLSAIRSVLRRSDPAATLIGDVAFEYGFSQPSRFAAYYRSHFGEKPSDTSRSRPMGIRSQN